MFEKVTRIRTDEELEHCLAESGRRPVFLLKHSST